MPQAKAALLIGLALAATGIVGFCWKNVKEDEEYSNEIKQIADANDPVRQRYKYQDVSQDSVTEQRQDVANNRIAPEQMAESYRKMYMDDLLPVEKESQEWARANPEGAGSLELKNMLEAGYHVGVNTIGSSLKNANLQIRSEPPNPIIPVSIFNNSSITPDIYRKELEIGECYGGERV